MNVTTYGLDLAKRVFQVYWVEPETGELKRKVLARAEVTAFFARCAPGIVAMESCGSAHYWGRVLSALRHQVRLLAAQFVRPFVKTNKTDAADAEAIWEAAQRPGVRFVALKSEEQQAVLSLHRMRAQLVKIRGMQVRVRRSDPTGLCARSFRSGGEFAAFLGLVPRQSGTGGRVKMLGISKRGDPYLRTLLIHGARSLMLSQSRADRVMDLGSKPCSRDGRRTWRSWRSPTKWRARSGRFWLMIEALVRTGGARRWPLRQIPELSEEQPNDLSRWHRIDDRTGRTVWEST